MFQQADRTKVIHALMRRVHKAVAKSHQEIDGVRRVPTISITLPGFQTELQIDGVDVKGLLVPDVPVAEDQRMNAFMDLIPHLGDSSLSPSSRTALRTQVGRLVLDFALLAPTPTGRMARLLWAFGKGGKVEVSNDTLVVTDASGEYGVRGGKMVGGVYEGTYLDLPISDLLKPDVPVVVGKSTAIEIRRVLHSRHDTEAYNIFCLLYVMAEWDSTILIDTLLMPKPRRVVRNLDTLSKELLNNPDPYRCLYRSMVPFFMTYTDFVAVFGRPERRGNIGGDARTKLINKLYMLPFFD